MMTMEELTAFTDEQLQDGIEHMAAMLAEGHPPRLAALIAADRVVPTHKGKWRPMAARIKRNGNFFRELMASYRDAHADL